MTQHRKSTYLGLSASREGNFRVNLVDREETEKEVEGERKAERVKGT